MKYSKGDLLAKARAEEPERRATSFGWEDIEGFIEEQVVGAGDHSTTDYMIIFERDDQLWGFVDWSHDEIGPGLSNDIEDDDVIDCHPVNIKPTIVYEFSDGYRP